MEAKKYPEHEKLGAVAERSQACYDFVCWLGERGIELARRAAGDELVPVQASMRVLLGEFFEIDHVRLEEEKVRMLNELAEANGG